MHVVNIHRKILPLPLETVGSLLDSVATEEDKIWPFENWPKIYLDEGLRVGSKGGHRPIAYEITDYEPRQFIRFKFSRPLGFEGYHQFEIKEVGEGQSEIKHTIKMDVVGKGIFTWYLVILHLHNALLRDLLTKVEASLGVETKNSPWNSWVKFLRWFLSGGKSAAQVPPRIKG